MTEAEWLGCDDPLEMLDFLRSRSPVSDRKERLFACGCCRRIWHLLKDPRSRDAVEAAESYVDGCFDGLAMSAVAAEADAAIGDVSLMSQAAEHAAVAAAQASSLVHMGRAAEAAAVAAGDALSPENWLQAKWDEQVLQSDMLRCVFGNPFRPVSIAPVWLVWNDGTVHRVAQAIYDERAFDRMPILADALEDAGCTNQAILDHCRQPGEHVRGCWVVDLLLGKS